MEAIKNLKKKIDPPKGGRQRAKEQKNKGLKSWGDTRNPKTVAAVVVAVVAAVVVEAESRTADNWKVVPRTAPQWRTIIITIF